jgi:hypothetical protein
MLSKNRFLATLLILCYLAPSLSPVWANWQTVNLNALLEPGLYLSQERWRIKPAQIVMTNQATENHLNKCYQRSVENFLNHYVINQGLKVKFSKKYQSFDLYREAQIKLLDKTDLSEFL